MIELCVEDNLVSILLGAVIGFSLAMILCWVAWK